MQRINLYSSILMCLPSAHHITQEIKPSASVVCSSRLLQLVKCYVLLNPMLQLTTHDYQGVIYPSSPNDDIGHNKPASMASKPTLISSPSPNLPTPQLLEVGVYMHSSAVSLLMFVISSVSHGSEIRFVYGAPPDNSTSATTLSRIMIDYWVSFATSLDPNDGRGIQRTSFIFVLMILIFPVDHDLHLGPHWGQYTTNQQVRRSV